MQALVVEEHGPIESLKLRKRPDPVPGPGEVLVDVHAASVNFPDLLVINGTYQFLPPRPFSPGKDFSGVVSAVGPGVTTRKPGDRVSAQIEFGAYAQKCVVREKNCHILPASMSYADAAAMGLVYLTAHFALVERARYREGEVVMVTGAAGGVGLAAVQVAKALKATVIATVSSDEKAALARANGADHIVRTDVPNLRESMREQVAQAIGKRGVDIIIESVGGDVFDASLRTIAWSGRVVVVGFASGRIPEVKAGYLLVKNIALIGLQWSSYRERTPDHVSEVQQELFRWYEAGKIKPHVMAAYPLARYLDALRAVRDRSVQGKVVLMMRE
ncbi:MAG: NADPH:quinone oxidoreductase family protein [Rhodospirillaceae bacterium]